MEQNWTEYTSEMLQVLFRADRKHIYFTHLNLRVGVWGFFAITIAIYTYYDNA